MTRLVAKTRAGWLLLRPGFIGASEGAAILGHSKFTTELDVYARKCGLVDELEDNAALEWGRRLEGVVADAYADKTGRRVENPGEYVVHIHPDHSCIGATLDRIIPEAEGKDGPGVLEVKTSSQYLKAQWDEGIPLGYQIQVQQQLAVTGYKWGALAVLIGGRDFRYADIERNDYLIARMIPALAEWWERHIVGDVTPAADGSENAAATLKALYPTSNGRKVALPDSFMDDAKRLEGLKLQKKGLETQIRAIENAVKQAIGENEVGTLSDGSSWTYREQSRAERVVKASTFRVLRRKKAK